MIKGIEFKDDKLVLIDQTKLPFIETYIITDEVERIARAIEKLEVRGAPAIGIAAAYALALAFKKKVNSPEDHFQLNYSRLASTRPTAMNLFWALDKMKKCFNSIPGSIDIYETLLNEANLIYYDDIDKCNRIVENGLTIFNKKLNVLTHCNTGALVTAGGGTALNIIINAFNKGFVNHVFAGETRPLLQGSRLTAFELDKANVPFSILPDSVSAFLMSQGRVDVVIVGADRIASNGDTANKIGTYNIAVNARYHNIPFYIAAPSSTIDKMCGSGENIKIEFRSSNEITSINGNQVTLEKYPVYSPAFDVTPSELITGIITETKVFTTPYNF